MRKACWISWPAAATNQAAAVWDLLGAVPERSCWSWWAMSSAELCSCWKLPQPADRGQWGRTRVWQNAADWC